MSLLRVQFYTYCVQMSRFYKLLQIYSNSSRKQLEDSLRATWFWKLLRFHRGLLAWRRFVQKKVDQRRRISTAHAEFNKSLIQDGCRGWIHAAFGTMKSHSHNNVLLVGLHHSKKILQLVARIALKWLAKLRHRQAHCRALLASSLSSLSSMPIDGHRSVVSQRSPTASAPTPTSDSRPSFLFPADVANVPSFEFIRHPLTRAPPRAPSFMLNMLKNPHILETLQPRNENSNLITASPDSMMIKSNGVDNHCIGACIGAELPRSLAGAMASTRTASVQDLAKVAPRRLSDMDARLACRPLVGTLPLSVNDDVGIATSNTSLHEHILSTASPARVSDLVENTHDTRDTHHYSSSCTIPHTSSLPSSLEELSRLKKIQKKQRVGVELLAFLQEMQKSTCLL